VVSFADITERKLAADLLKQERDFAENLLETAPVVVLLLDAGGKILHFNSFTERLSGYSLAEGKGQSWLDTFLVARDIPRAAQDFARARDAVLEVRFGHTIVTRDGRQRLISWYVKDLAHAANEEARLLAIGLDVTEERTREAQLIQAQKMETVGQLTDGVAHDFNNLLTVILGNLKLLGDSIDANSDPEVSELLEDAVSAGRDGAELTQRLLGFSRQEPLRRKSFDLAAFLQDLERFLRRTMRSDLVAKFHIGAHINQILGDPPRLQSALLNLALNARDAMPNGGLIDFRVDLKQVGDQDEGLAPGTYVELSVIDSGEGMTPEQLAQAIRPFYTTKVSGQGSGLGLSMVFRFCEQSGGRFQLASELGAGTKATILLPVNGTHGDEAEQTPQTTPPALLTAKGRTILLVDDEERVRKLARRYLTDLGYDVIMAEDGKKAIEILQCDTAIDLVFSDIVMPGGINGNDLCRWVKEQRPELNVLLTTGLISGRMKGVS
jgi:PAS domain S-box-containing protein